jgi:hypothetical protein
MTNVRNYTTKELLDKVKSLPSFKGIPKGYWILGASSIEDAPNSFDDKFYLFYDEANIDVATGTTNPGTPVLEGGFLKYNKAGAAVVKSEEWYYDVWTYGLHMGKMPALKQVGNFIVFRDGNKNKKSEEIGKPITGSNYGINFHAATYNALSKTLQTIIGWWSAGCQVLNDKQKHLKWIGLMKSQKRISYVLIKETKS